MKPVQGIHHISNITGPPQQILDFYCGILGLRLVKKTVNFDDPGTYHLYVGNEKGEPGTLLTFFPWADKDRSFKGAQGNGQVTTISFSIPEDAVDFWVDRFKENDVEFEEPSDRFEERVIPFYDPDGMRLELVANNKDNRTPWIMEPITEDVAIRGFYHITSSVPQTGPSAELLTHLLGLKEVASEGNRTRYSVSGDVTDPSAMIDLYSDPSLPAGRMGSGTVHHIAWRATDEEHQQELRQILVEHNLNATPVLDRKYFKSIYFREPGHVLYEIATDPPGLDVDESVDELGDRLQLPPWIEPNRPEIENLLPELDTEKFKSKV